MVGLNSRFTTITAKHPLTPIAGSIPSTSSTRPQSVTPQTPRRPGPVKRAPSSSKPFRGAEFSVDDEPEEVDNDLKLVRQKTRDTLHKERASLRRKESKGTLRRRPTAQAPTLAKVDSEEGDEEAAEGLASGIDKSTASLPGKPIPQDNAEPSSEDTLRGEEEEEQLEEDDDTDTPGSDDDDDDDDADLSDAESFTLRDRQEAINETHPFGIRIWKPALYKKNRSVQRNAESDIHSAPGGRVSRWLSIFNMLWVVIFGWWLALVAAFGGVLCYFFGLLGAEGCHDYGRVLINLSSYLFYPFGKYVKLEHDEAYLDEDEGEGRSIGEYERWQTGDLEEGRLFFGPHDVNRSLIGRRRDEVEDLPNETDSLLGRHDRNSSGQRSDTNKTKKRLFGRGKWDTGRVIFFLSFYFLITPCLFFVSAICWFLVFTIPMGKVTLLLFYHLRRHPLALSFHTDSNYSRVSSPSSNSHSILMCTYRAVGSKYWKYTIDGTNIFLINMLGLVAFTIVNYFLLFETLHIETWFTSPGFNFILGLLSIIPLAYFIGQAVASISAQSSMGVGATINAFFSTVVEVFLYCVALHQGKGQLVEGSIVGSIFAGILFLPGLSMCFGALKRKTQRFNVRSASATNTMLLFAVIGAFGPTLFYQIYGSHELNCHQCTRFRGHGPDSDCRRCYFSQTPAVQTKFYIEAVRPYTWFAAVLLFLSYIIGLLFTLRTHAAVIWNNEPDEKKEAKVEHASHRVEERHGSLSASTSGLDHPRDHLSRNPTAGTITPGNIRDSQMYQRILNQSLKQAGLASKVGKKIDEEDSLVKHDGQTPHLVPPKSADDDSASIKGARIQGLSAEDNRVLVQQVAEMAATAAAVATRDATKAPHKAAHMAATRASSSYRHSSVKDGESRERHGGHSHRGHTAETASLGEVAGVVGDPAMASATAVATGAHEQASGGHDAPNWSRTKSAVILLTATVAYAIIAEILVDTVDSVLSNVDIDEKFLGITVFALVPNATEFLNAISFAMNGNIALSMEIGNSYALQVMLLQIPAVVLFTAIYGQFFDDPAEYADHAFTLIFPQWDMVTVILGVFLMGYVVGEGKSNYFKGSSLILTYLVFVVGFYFSGFNNLDVSAQL
jgi:Ca2+:H+ antiporter